jgi:hypothetical protein
VTQTLVKLKAKVVAEQKAQSNLWQKTFAKLDSENKEQEGKGKEKAEEQEGKGKEKEARPNAEGEKKGEAKEKGEVKEKGKEKGEGGKVEKVEGKLRGRGKRHTKTQAKEEVGKSLVLHVLT